jgi:hypothetical protein
MEVILLKEPERTMVLLQIREPVSTLAPLILPVSSLSFAENRKAGRERRREIRIALYCSVRVVRG